MVTQVMVQACDLCTTMALGQTIAGCHGDRGGAPLTPNDVDFHRETNQRQGLVGTRLSKGEHLVYPVRFVKTYFLSNANK